MTARHRDDGARLGAFTDEVLAVCPSCGGCVRVLPAGAGRRATCGRCAWTREAGGEATTWGVARDPYLGLPLWLAVPCAGEVLWALNEAHLGALEAYVGAGLRERAVGRDHFSMLERLPAWLKAAKNREEVLAGLARLRGRLAEA